MWLNTVNFNCVKSHCRFTVLSVLSVLIHSKFTVLRVLSVLIHSKFTVLSVLFSISKSQVSLWLNAVNFWEFQRFLAQKKNDGKFLISSHNNRQKEVELSFPNFVCVLFLCVLCVCIVCVLCVRIHFRLIKTKLT